LPPFSGELSAAELGKQPIPRASIVVAGPPFGPDEAAAFETIERGIQRTLVDAENVVASPLNRLGDPIAVHGPELEELEDEKIEGAGDEVPFPAGHEALQSIIDMKVRTFMSIVKMKRKD
jgi:hypothetical protein